MAFVGRALPTLRAAGLMMGISVLAAAGVGYWFFVSQQRHYIVGRDFRILSNLTRQVDSTARAEARVIQNLPKQPRGTSINSDLKTLPATWFQFRGKPYQPGDITFEKKKLPTDRARPGYTFRADSHLMLDVPVPGRSAGGEELTASLNLQRGLESLFSSRVGPAGFDAILLGTRDGRVLVSAGPVAQQLRFSGLDVLSSKATEANKPVKFKELSETITMAEVSVAGVDYTFSSRLAACRRNRREIDSSWRGSCAAKRCAPAAGRFRQRSSRSRCLRCCSPSSDGRSSSSILQGDRATAWA